MKKSISIVTIITILILFSCKKEKNEEVSVVRDCTGTYLHFNGKDYQVCNSDKLASFENGFTVKATFKRIKKCEGSANLETKCTMIHSNEGWIEVEKIE